MSINVAHSEFAEQKGGLMICGYEWGESKADQAGGAGDSIGHAIDWNAVCTFANKNVRYGPRALTWAYDARIRKWFGMWGFELDTACPGSFEKSIVQTNWCDTQNHNMNGNYERLNDDDQVDNFLAHVDHFRPRMILFMGSQMIHALQRPATIARFQSQMGQITNPLTFSQKPFEGRRFRVAFQSFENCEVVCLPHPSGSHGLSDDYIDLFSSQIGALIAGAVNRI